MTVGERIVTVGASCFLVGIVCGMLFLRFLSIFLEERNIKLRNKIKESKIIEPVIL
jgi:uncharacterized membrane protein YciS (DUF1049 family)